jgi:hypothetical protein
MYSELFVAQHHDQPVAGGTAGTIRRNTVGYFASFDDAVRALDEKYRHGCWQGIQRDATRERWWRDDTTSGWSGPSRTRTR